MVRDTSSKIQDESSLISTLNLSLKKEFALYSNTHSVSHQTAVDDLIDKSGKLQLNTYQAFVRNLFNPASEYISLLLIHGTGTGKTITSLAVASEYQKQYREFTNINKNTTYNDIRSIVIVGYTKDIFKNELISHPEFGFISDAEIAELRELRKAEHESKAIADKIFNLRNKFYRRISDRRMNGIYEFYGFRQLFNRVVNQQDLTKQLRQLNDTSDISILDPGQVRMWIRDGAIRLNRTFIETLRNSLIICDEVHNIYYHKDVNVYGLAIEIITDYFNEPKLYNPTWSPNDEKCIRWLFLSATPLSYAPTEIVPIINLLNLKPFRIQQSDIFDEKTKEMTTKGLSLISQRVDKKISYVMDDNPTQYPTAIFEGIPIKSIPYLKFIRCRMSEPHEAVIEQYLQHDNSTTDDTSTKANTIKDIVFQSGIDKSKLLFRFNEVSSEIREGISPYKEDSNGLLTSDLLDMRSLETYSSKYFYLMKQIIALKGLEHGKLFVYHPYVQSTGTNLLTSIFRTNGLLNEDEPPSANSICMTCDKLYKDHQCDQKSKACEFIGVRFIVITGYISKAAIVNRLNQYNSPENSNGQFVKILLGSRAMRESHTLKACKHLMIVHQPASISEMIQIIGRGVRKHSHALLAPKDRNIKLYIFVSSNHTGNELSLEETGYYEKMRLYVQIQQIERIFFDQSVDYLINFRFKQREVPKLIGESFALDLDLYKKYSTDKSYSLNKLTNISNNSFYFTRETELCRLIIKRIMLEYQPVIAKSKLYELVRDPPFQIEADTNLLSNEAIECALDEVISGKIDSIVIDDSFKSAQSIDSLFNESKIIVGLDHRQMHIKINSNELIYIEPIDDPIDDMHELFMPSTQMDIVKRIDLEDLFNRWNDLVHIEDIVTDLEEEFSKTNTIDATIVIRMSQFTIETHTKLLEYCIIAIAYKIFRSKKLSINPQLLIQLTEYYIEKGVTITIGDTVGSIVASHYKKYNIHTGLSWQEVVLARGKSTRINYSSMPIGHYIKHTPRLISINSLESTPIWNEYSSIIPITDWKFPSPIIGYEERSKGIDHVFKIKDLSDKSSKGINAMFMQSQDLLAICKQFKITFAPKTKKMDIVKALEHYMQSTEAKYRKEKNINKVYFRMHETIPS